MNLIDQVKAARRVHTPLLVIQTADQPATQIAIATALNGSAPAFVWDAIRGIRPADKIATAWFAKRGFKPEDIAANTGNINAALDWAVNLPGKGDPDIAPSAGGAILFLTNAGQFFGDAVTMTGVLNLREPFKGNKRTLIGTDSAFSLPASLQSSVVVIDEPLPSDVEVREIIDRVVEQAKGIGEATEATRDESVSGVRGLSAFMAEQVIAMSLSKETGIDTSEVWARKRIAFNQTPGVTLEKEDGPTFADIEGLTQILAREKAHFGGSNAAAVVVRIEEIDKVFPSAAQGDTSGTSQAALGYLLDYMEEKRSTGFLAVGPGGSGKSLVSKALGREFRRPVVTFDIEATKGSLVGESGAKIRAAFKAITALAGDRPVLFVATCNKLESLPPELRRRFTQGIWFFDLPTTQERAAIWKLYGKKHGLSIKAADLPNDANWTGAEIRNCVETAATEGITLKEAAEFIVPVAEADPQALSRLRDLAHDHFLNASAPGKYRKPGTAVAEVTGGRDIEME